MSALVPSSTPHLNSPSFDGSTLVQDDGQLEDSIPPQLRSRDWFRDASLPLLVKRAVDFTGALVGLILLTPVILIIALVIRLEGRGPILFRQLRRGYRGRLFRVIKFRTMCIDAEQRLVHSKKATNPLVVCSSSSGRILALHAWGGFCDSTVSMSFHS